MADTRPDVKVFERAKLSEPTSKPSSGSGKGILIWTHGGESAMKMIRLLFVLFRPPALRQQYFFFRYFSSNERIRIGAGGVMEHNPQRSGCHLSGSTYPFRYLRLDASNNGRYEIKSTIASAGSTPQAHTSNSWP